MVNTQAEKQKTIALTREMIMKIKNGYFEAKKLCSESFLVGDIEFNTAYAGYFLEYHAPKFGVRFDRDSF